MSARGMLRHMVGFEWRLQRKSPVFWVSAAMFFALGFSGAAVDDFQIGARGNVHVNAPVTIVETVALFSLFAMFFVVAMVAGAVIRDDESGFTPIVRSTSVTKASYLLGRFTGASAAALCVLATVPAGLAVGSLMPWIDPEKLGPFQLAHYAYALLVFGAPTLLLLAAAFFALATATRSMLWTYIGAVAALVFYVVTRNLLRDPAFHDVAALTDPFGLSALRLATRYWTAAERNTLLPSVSGVLLANRALWSGVAIALFAFAYRRFQFAAPAARPARARPTRATVPRPEPGDAAPAPAPLPTLPAPRADRATRLAQLWRLARFDLGFVFRSPAFLVLVVLGVANAFGAMWLSGRLYGADSYPSTRRMVEALLGAFSVFPTIIAVFYGGELVWRDRERRLHEIVDATPAPTWAHLAPKIAAIALALAATAAAGIATGVVIQLITGYAPLELGAYLAWFAVPTVITGLQLAVLTVCVQVVVPHKYVGWGVMLLYLVVSIALGLAGLEHNLYNYAGTSPVPLSDMNGMGRFWIGRAWFQAYWSAIALVLAVIAYGRWRRGATTALRVRLAGLPARLGRGARALLGGAIAAAIASGAFIYYNTNILNAYVPSPVREAQLARYERDLLVYETTPQPRITSVTLDVQLYPREARAVTTGRYRIENRTGAPIDELHVAAPIDLALDRVELDGASLARAWPEHNYRIYKLAVAMRPGEVRELGFTTTLGERGFPNSAPLIRIVENGTFIANFEIAPSLGVARRGLLSDRGKRRKHGLPADLRPPTLEDERGRARNVLRPDSDWVTADLTVTTDADQTPIAPGTQVSDTVAAGRRTARFVTDAPINHFFSIQSGRYEIRRDTWNGVALAVYFHPGHDANIERMLTAMKTSLALFGAAFSPYQFHQARILEFPSYADYAQSFANTIPYSENIGFLTRVGGPDTIDVPTYITAHEVAHQWWGHQLVPSEQQGATLLVETFAQYSALLVMERLYGKDQIRRFLKYELDRYLATRGGEVVEELPLARVENQPYIHYQKGSLAMYWLKEVVGEPVVNRALAKLLAQYAFHAAPYPTSLDFLRLLRAEAGPQHDALITDLFERITLVDVRTRGAQASPRPDGSFEVTLDVTARKLYADGTGVETEAPLDEPFDVGVFTAEPGKAGTTGDAVLSMTRMRVRSGTQRLTVVVPRRPRFAGVDPYNKRIDRNSDDNIVEIVDASGEAR